MKSHLLTAALGSAGAAACATAPPGGDGAPGTVGQGSLAPDFRLETDEEAWVTLSQHRGQDHVLLVFFPLAFTPV